MTLVPPPPPGVHHRTRRALAPTDDPTGGADTRRDDSFAAAAVAAASDPSAVAAGAALLAIQTETSLTTTETTIDLTTRSDSRDGPTLLADTDIRAALLKAMSVQHDPENVLRAAEICWLTSTLVIRRSIVDRHTVAAVCYDCFSTKKLGVLVAVAQFEFEFDLQFD